MFLNSFFYFQLQIQSLWQIASTHRPSRSNKKILQKLRSTDGRNQKTREWSLAEAKARNGPLCGQLASHAWPIILHWAAKGQWVLFTPRRLVWKSKTFWTPELVTPPPPIKNISFVSFLCIFFWKKEVHFHQNIHVTWSMLKVVWFWTVLCIYIFPELFFKVQCIVLLIVYI